MDPNPILRKLGFADRDRVAIVHVDDVGMCQATLPAFTDLLDFGLVSCGSVMVPCPWFPLVGQTCRQRPGIDLGVHLTLTSEWDVYRWGPLSTRDPASGLIDEEGYFPRRSEDVQRRGEPEAARLELQAQVAHALDAGIDVTHVDTHMGSVVHPKFMLTYVQLALQHGLPLMMLRLDEAGWRRVGAERGIAMDSHMVAGAAQMVQQLEAQGVPLLDDIATLPLDQPAERVEQAKRVFDSLPSGITHFFIHPALDTPELRTITSDWESRLADYQAFSSPELRDYVTDSGVQVIGYRDLLELM